MRLHYLYFLQFEPQAVNFLAPHISIVRSFAMSVTVSTTKLMYSRIKHIKVTTERKPHKFTLCRHFIAHTRKGKNNRKKLSSSFSKSFQQLAIEVNYNSVPGSTRRLRTNGHSPQATKKLLQTFKQGTSTLLMACKLFENFPTDKRNGASSPLNVI